MKEYIKSGLWIPALIGLLVYCQSIWFGTAWGDDQLVISPISKDFNLMLKIFYDNSSVPGLHFCPVYFLQCYLINLLFGDKAFPFGFHLYQVVMNVIACVLATLLLYEITKNRLMSILIVALWVVHPLNVEILTRLGSGPAQLAAGVFCLAFMLSFLRLRKVNGFAGRVVSTALGILFFLAMMTTHEQYIFMPLVLLLIYFYLEGRKIFQDKKYIYFLVLPLMMIYPMYLMWRYYACGGVLYETSDELIKWTEMGSVRDVLFRAYWLAPQILMHYFRLFLWPDYLGESKADWFKVGSSIWDPYSMFCQLVIVGIIISGVVLYRRNPIYSIGVTWFLLTMILVSQVAPLFVMIDEHYCYISMLGILLMLFSVIIKNLEKINKNILLISVVLIFGLLLWRTELYIPKGNNLITNIVAIAKYSPPWVKVLHMDEALRLARSINKLNELPEWTNRKAIFEEADKWLKRYLYVEPDLSYKFGPMQVYVNFNLYKRLYEYLYQRGRLQELNTLINQSIKVKNDSFSIHQSAQFLSDKGQWEQALIFLEKAIQLNPDNADLYGKELLEIALYGNKYYEVEGLIKRYIQLKLKSSHPYLYAGLFYRLFSENKEALTFFQEAISEDKEISIHHKHSYLEAANVFIENNLLDKARETLNIVSIIDPNDQELKQLLEKIGRL